MSQMSSDTHIRAVAHTQMQVCARTIKKNLIPKSLGPHNNFKIICMRGNRDADLADKSTSFLKQNQ